MVDNMLKSHFLFVILFWPRNHYDHKEEARLSTTRIMTRRGRRKATTTTTETIMISFDDG